MLIMTSSAFSDSELEEARPSSIGEEEMQLQIALALSREECEKEEELRKGDAIRLQMALEESKKKEQLQQPSSSKAVDNTIDDLLSLNLGEPVQIAGPSGLGNSNDPWTVQSSAPTNEPWSPIKKPVENPCKLVFIILFF